jgi:glycerol-1-phosphate dehydrogenase [NAD(P)+]
VIEQKSDHLTNVTLANYLLKKIENATSTKLLEFQEIWKKTFEKEPDRIKIEKRNYLLKNLEIHEKIHTNIIISKDALKDLLKKISKYAVITDKTVFPIIKRYLCELLKPYCLYYIDDLDGEELTRIINAVKSNGSELLLGLGGGRVMDYLKFIQMETKLFSLAIPTSLATHVYASPKLHALPAIKELGYAKTIDGPVPDLAILDITFLKNLKQSKPRLINAGLGDLMAYITAVEDWKLAEQYLTTKTNTAVIEMCNESITNLNKINVEDILENWISDYVLMQVLLCEITGWVGSAPASGSEHLFALAAEKDFDNPPLHGELVALGTLIMTYIHGGDTIAVFNLIKKLQLPCSLKEIALSKQQVITALENGKLLGIAKGRFTISNTLSMNIDFCEKVVSELISYGFLEY